MNEKLLTDYLKDNALNTSDLFDIEGICQHDEFVTFCECYGSNYRYVEHHTVSLLDVVAWVYSKAA